MFTNAEDLQGSKCTSCEILDDTSVYWISSLYFQHDNGSFNGAAPLGRGSTLKRQRLETTTEARATSGEKVPAEKVHCEDRAPFEVLGRVPVLSSRVVQIVGEYKWAVGISPRAQFPAALLRPCLRQSTAQQSTEERSR